MSYRIFWKFLLATLALWMTAYTTLTGQSNLALQIKQRVNGQAISTAAKPYRELLANFYRQRGYEPLWLGARGTFYQTSFACLLLEYDQLGLRKSEYAFEPLMTLLTREYLASVGDSADREIALTLTLFRFYHDLYAGRQMPALGYAGWSNRPFPAKAGLDFTFPQARDIRKLAYALEPKSAVYRLAVERLRFYITITSKRNFSDIQLRTLKTAEDSLLLADRLRQLGFLYSGSLPADSSQWDTVIRRAQRGCNLEDDGKPGRQTLAAWNVPIKKRMQQLENALNDYRWLNSQQRNEPVIVVNIPSALLRIYENDSSTLQMRVVLGKPATRTPRLASRVLAVELFPYWRVPSSIARRELLPKIKSDIHFLDRNNYQVLDAQGKVVAPGRVNWKSLSSSYFPYQLRQAVGCDNALGILKLDVPSSYSVYLHDTPEKDLFARQHRFFSHGCIRLEEPVALARRILPANTLAVDTLTDEAARLHDYPVILKAERDMKLLVWYNQVDVNEAGELCFFEDIYRLGKP